MYASSRSFQRELQPRALHGLQPHELTLCALQPHALPSLVHLCFWHNQSDNTCVRDRPVPCQYRHEFVGNYDGVD